MAGTAPECAGLERERAPPPPSARELGSSPRAPAGREAGGGKRPPSPYPACDPAAPPRHSAPRSPVNPPPGLAAPGGPGSWLRVSTGPGSPRVSGRLAQPRRAEVGARGRHRGRGWGVRRAGRGSVAVPEQSSPRFEINPLPARAAPAGAEPPLPPTPALPARDPARQSAPLDRCRGESDCRHLPPTPPPARLGEKSSKTFSFSFFLFANTLYPRSKLGDEIWLVQG